MITNNKCLIIIKYSKAKIQYSKNRLKFLDFLNSTDNFKVILYILILLLIIK